MRSSRGKSVRAVVISAVVGSLVGSLFIGMPALADPATPGAASRPVTSVPVNAVKPKPVTPAQTDGPGLTRLDNTTLPSAGSAVIAVSSSASVGGLPVAVSGATPVSDESLPAGRRRQANAPTIAKVRVQVVDRALATVAGVSGAVLVISPADGGTGSGLVQLRVDYTSFANAYGADYGRRLRLVRLPACVLTTPSEPRCQAQTDLGSVNAGGAVAAEVPVAGPTTAAAAAPSTVVGLTAGSSSDGGTWSATSLSPAYSWSAGTQGGEFAFGYPFAGAAVVGWSGAAAEPDLLEWFGGCSDPRPQRADVVGG
jgi:hypothetical protein